MAQAYSTPAITWPAQLLHAAPIVDRSVGAPGHPQLDVLRTDERHISPVAVSLRIWPADHGPSIRHSDRLNQYDHRQDADCILGFVSKSGRV